jgi:iron complex outermembrane receptor protein
LLCTLATPIHAVASQTNRIIKFDIDRTTADISLIEFAKQANLTIVFPYEKVKDSIANPLFGKFSVENGIQVLLQSTDLVAKFSNQGVLTIQSKADNEEKVDKSILAGLFDLLTDDGDNIITYPQQKESPYELILVKGIRGSMQRTIDIKHSSSGLEDAISAEEIGKFPDLNLAESLQRITGVSIDRSEGEGQFVTVRGFGPQFNNVLLNGRKLATDNQGREFSFDTLPSELISAVSVFKTFSASQSSGGIGSTINIKTARPLSNRGFKIAGSLKAMYDTNSEESTPQGTILVSHSNEKFGWLVSLSHQEREARINEAQTDGWLLNTNIPKQQLSSNANNIFVPRNYDQRVRFDDRKRTSGTLVLQYRPTADIDMSLDYLNSDFNVRTDSTSMGHWFTSSNLENVITDTNGTVIQFEQKIGHATDFHARTFDRLSSTTALGFNLDWQFSRSLNFEFDLSSSNAAIDDTRGAANSLSLVGYLNRSVFDHSAGNQLPSISGFETANPDIVDAMGQATGVANYLDPVNGKAHVMLRRGWNIRDNFDQARIDGRWDSDIEPITAVKFGLMYTRQTKLNERWDNEKDAVHCTFCGYFDQPDIPDSFQTEFSAGNDFLDGISGNSNVPNQWLRHDGKQLFSFLEQSSDISFAAVQRNNSFAIKEQVFGAYTEIEYQLELANMPFTVLAGLRFENTDIDVTGVEATLQALTILDQTELGQITSTPLLFSQQSSYTNWLPNFTAKLEVNENLVTKMAYSQSMTRPTMTQMSPNLVLNTTRQGGDLRVSSGNPELEPFEATNFDLGLEWFYAASSYLSVSYFRKTVDNFIVSTTSDLIFAGVTDPSTGTNTTAPDEQDSIALFNLTQPNNGETATVDGWEFAIQHNFDSGFGILANMTLVDSNAQLDPNDVSQTFALTGLSDSQNLIVYYENGASQVRLAWNNRDEFLQSLVQSQGAEPTFVERYHQLDMSASYAISDNISITFEGVNLTEEHVIKHGRHSNQLLLAQAPGARYSIGVRGHW